MKTFTVAVYWVFAALAMAAGIVALIVPERFVPDGLASGLTNHLIREEAALFIFISLMFVWCLRNYERRHSVHFPLLVFIVIFAGIHWEGYLRDPSDILSPVVNTIPVILLAATAPFSRES